MFKTKNGITLIALVITIIVLLILAGVSISAITGDNGIVQKARESSEKTAEAEKEELETLGNLEQYINDETGENEDESESTEDPDETEENENESETTEDSEVPDEEIPTVIGLTATAVQQENLESYNIKIRSTWSISETLSNYFVAMDPSEMATFRFEMVLTSSIFSTFSEEIDMSNIWSISGPGADMLEYVYSYAEGPYYKIVFMFKQDFVDSKNNVAPEDLFETLTSTIIFETITFNATSIDDLTTEEVTETIDLCKTEDGGATYNNVFGTAHASIGTAKWTITKY